MTQGITVDLAELIALSGQVLRLSAHKARSVAMQYGQHRSLVHGRGMDFAETRHYQSGDDIKHMEWRVTARTGKPHVKVYQEEREIPVMILVDFNSSMYFGTRVMFKSVLAAKLAALIAWTASYQGDRVGGLLSSSLSHHEWVPRGRDIGVLPFLAGLSNYTKQKPQDHDESRSSLLQALSRLNRVTKPGSILTIISDFYSFNDECKQLLIRLSMQHNILAYHICDPLELNPPEPKSYGVTNGFDENIWDTTSAYARKSYTETINENLVNLKDFCINRRIQYTQVTPTQDLALLVKRSFPWRRHG